MLTQTTPKASYPTGKYDSSSGRFFSKSSLTNKALLLQVFAASCAIHSVIKLGTKPELLINPVCWKEMFVERQLKHVGEKFCNDFVIFF